MQCNKINECCIPVLNEHIVNYHYVAYTSHILISYFEQSVPSQGGILSLYSPWLSIYVLYLLKINKNIEPHNLIYLCVVLGPIYSPSAPSHLITLFSLPINVIVETIAVPPFLFIRCLALPLHSIFLSPALSWLCPATAASNCCLARLVELPLL
jgi:hypothetical protein